MLNTTIHEFRALVRFWQECNDLKVDGVLGPKTRASLLKSECAECTQPPKGWMCKRGNGHGGPCAPLKESDSGAILMNRIIRYALADEGKGEKGGNNAGTFVRGLRKFCGFPVDLLGAWCAIFASAKILMASRSLGLSLPCKLSRGAHRLVMAVGECEQGRFITTPEPGFACWKRRRWLRTREAHVRIITGYDVATDTIHYVAGNEKGRVVVSSLPDGAWRKDLICMSTFV